MLEMLHGRGTHAICTVYACVDGRDATRGAAHNTRVHILRTNEMVALHGSRLTTFRSLRGTSAHVEPTPSFEAACTMPVSATLKVSARLEE